LTKESNVDINYRFGKAIRRRRRELDLSQEQLAERAELHRTYISSIERGRMNPSLENVEKLTNALGISISALFTNYGIEIPKQSE
jgi:transcriptional regulator with XRE-family HTH domain